MKNTDAPGPTQEQVAKDFDNVAASYRDDLDQTLAFTGMEHTFFVNLKRDHIVRLAQEHFSDLSAVDALDLGCGVGAYHSGLKGRFRELHGIDVSTQSIQVAAAQHPFVRYATFDGVRLPYADGQFALTFAVCVMHHVPPEQWASLLKELHRVTRPNGLLLIFEHNPYNPATQYVVKTCDIDKDAVLLRPRTLKKLAEAAGFQALYTKTIISVPPSSAFLKRLDALLGHLPFGAQYYLRGVKAPA
ncbi:class I SAM-dependent methyltransferase [Hydrogenophaga sp. BPS33]|uniref:class I SAM-dependent methyltransferase n=1 Tax=Hydrogenophaga sp. BPS33 TaxID=2651974 RepID=UPI00132000AF|nr:class I SAM-dependent methyltransferase [Hydrogenophaga sp. BPS33]QHE83743.1 class I SAM-dependent methyltransferase [Hydrogenophaga sp. BPS33]